jgi:hypothetical protein
MDCTPLASERVCSSITKDFSDRLHSMNDLGFGQMESPHFVLIFRQIEGPVKSSNVRYQLVMVLSISYKGQLHLPRGSPILFGEAVRQLGRHSA